MPEILVVCTANICRSPVVEAILRARLAARDPSGWRVASAGTMAFPGYGAAEHSTAVMAERGFDLGGHRSQPTDERRLAAADLVLCMEPGHKRALVTEFPHHRHKVWLLTEMVGEEHEVEDPIGGPRAGYERMVDEVMDLIDRGLPRIVELVAAGNAEVAARNAGR
jgi:protein-tyrosine-phosphatase